MEFWKYPSIAFNTRYLGFPNHQLVSCSTEIQQISKFQNLPYVQGKHDRAFHYKSFSHDEFSSLHPNIFWICSHQNWWLSRYILLIFPIIVPGRIIPVSFGKQDRSMMEDPAAFGRHPEKKIYRERFFLKRRHGKRWIDGLWISYILLY